MRGGCQAELAGKRSGGIYDAVDHAFFAAEMEDTPALENQSEPLIEPSDANPDSVCPVCGGPLISEKCKVVCRSERCRYRIVFNCAEF